MAEHCSELISIDIRGCRVSGSSPRVLRQRCRNIRFIKCVRGGEYKSSGSDDDADGETCGIAFEFVVVARHDGDGRNGDNGDSGEDGEEEGGY